VRLFVSTFADSPSRLSPAFAYCLLPQEHLTARSPTSASSPHVSKSDKADCPTGTEDSQSETPELSRHTQKRGEYTQMCGGYTQMCGGYTQMCGNYAKTNRCAPHVCLHVYHLPTAYRQHRTGLAPGWSVGLGRSDWTLNNSPHTIGPTNPDNPFVQQTKPSFENRPTQPSTTELICPEDKTVRSNPSSPKRRGNHPERPGRSTQNDRAKPISLNDRTDWL